MPGWALRADSSASSATMPPSPRLSARRISSAYLSEMIRISAHRISDTTPRIASGVSCPAMGGGLGGFLQRIKRAGADVAIDHAERADGRGQGKRGGMARAAAGMAVTGEPPDYRANLNRSAKSQSATPRRKLLRNFYFSRCRNQKPPDDAGGSVGLEVRRACRMGKWFSDARRSPGGLRGPASWSRRRGGRRLRYSARIAARSRRSGHPAGRPWPAAAGTLASTCGAKPGRTVRAAAMNAAMAIAESALIMTVPCHGPWRPRRFR